MISPSSFAVFALKFLQKSMMFTPCGPSAVPTGGAGVALPAAIWSFTIAWIFFAMRRGQLFLICAWGPTPAHSRSRRYFETTLRSVRRSVVLNLLHLQEIELHWRRPPEDRHHHLQRVL